MRRRERRKGEGKKRRAQEPRRLEREGLGAGRVGMEGGGVNLERGRRFPVRSRPGAGRRPLALGAVGCRVGDLSLRSLKTLPAQF